MKRRKISILCCVALLIATTLWMAEQAPATAQTLAYGQIQGTVTDQSGGVIPGASVTVRNQGTGAERDLVSDDSGNYRAVNLQPGAYDVIVGQQGFATLRTEGIEVQVGATVRLDAVLTVAATEQTITVTAVTPIVEPEKTGYTATVSEVSIENLPINGRRWENFVLLTPTTQPDGDFGLVSYRGISGLYNNNSVDGADNNQGFFSEARGRTRVSYTLSQSAIKEFQVGLSNYSAEYGRAVGGTVNAVTKSGNNAFHGQAFYFLRDDSMNAREPFNNAQGFDQLKDRRQQFGFNLGGPIKEDKLFYFLNYDHQLRNFPGIAIDGRQLRDSAGTLFTQSGFNLSEICDFGTVGQARCQGARDQLLSRLGPFSRKGLNNVALGKLDWIINDKHNFGAQYNWHKWRSPSGIQTQDRTNDTPLANGFDGVRTDFFLAHWTYIASPSTLNEFRFQLGRDFEFQRANTNGPQILHNSQLDIDDGQRNFLPREKFPEEYRLQFVDNLTWIRGNHMLKFGVDINHLNDEMINLFTGGGSFDFRSFEAFAMDVPLAGIPIFDDGARTGKHYRDFRQAFDLVTGG
ncbi:MAG: carboxypeptidase regulatory-like domain-containing protein, partial [Acidobacteriota bacterium]